MQLAEGKHVLFPELLPGAVDDGRGVVRIERAAAQAGKVFAAAKCSRLAEAGEKGFGVGDDAFWIVGDDAGAHHVGGSGGAKVEHGCEGDVEAEQAKLGADEIAVLTAEPPAPGCGDGRRRGHGRNEIAEAIDEAAFNIDGMEEWAVGNTIRRCSRAARGSVRPLRCCGGRGRACGLDQAQPGALRGIEFRSGESNKE